VGLWESGEKMIGVLKKNLGGCGKVVGKFWCLRERGWVWGSYP